MSNRIPHSRPTLGPEEERACRRALRSGQVGGGEEVDRLEREMERFLGGGHAVAVHTGTAALHLALLALDVGPGDRVVLPTYTCAAVLNAVRYTGARPILADVLPETANLDPADVRRRLRARTRAIVVPHMFGRTAPLAEFRAMGVPIVEDCAMSLGGGTGLGGDVSVFSFYGTKMMATGQGGMVVARSRRAAERIRDLVSHDNREDYRVRYNYRMSGLVAAVGRAQLEKIPEFVKRRRRIAEYYYGTLGLGRPPAGHVFYRFVLRVASVRDFIQKTEARGVECKRPVFRPLHRYFQEPPGGFPGAEELHRSCASVPIYPSLRSGEMARVVRAVRHALG